MLKELENFDHAFQHLSTVWENSSEKAKGIMQKIPFPLHKSLDELSEQVHYWVEDCKEALKETIPYEYAVCKKDISFFQETHFYEIQVLGNTVDIYDSMDNNLSSGDVTENEFKEHFFKVPKEMFDLYILLCANGEGFEDIQKLALKLYGEGGDF